MEQRILVVDDDPEVVAYLRTNLERFGFAVDSIDGPEQLERQVIERRPDVILLDILLPDGDGFSALRRVTAGRHSDTIPIIVVTARGRITDRVRALRLGADDYVVKPFDMRELVARVRTVLRRARQLRDLSPLTGLPGNVGITREADRRLDRGEPLAVVHVDIDNFKSFNDRYGFLRGDGVISFCARCLGDAASDHPAVFVGHIGGDDFVVILRPDDVTAFCDRVIASWEAGIGAFYDVEDVAAGGVTVEDRSGVERLVPIATVSMGVATSLQRRFSSVWEASAIAAEMKEHAKRKPGSRYEVDRRNG